MRWTINKLHRRTKAAGWNSSLVHSILAPQNPVACDDCSQTKFSMAINHRINALSDPTASFGGHICILWFTRQCQPPEMLVSTGALCVARCRKQVRSVLNKGLYVGPDFLCHLRNILPVSNLAIKLAHTIMPLWCNISQWQWGCFVHGIRALNIFSDK